jgi:hypothetical protein
MAMKFVGASCVYSLEGLTLCRDWIEPGSLCSRLHPIGEFAKSQTFID